MIHDAEANLHLHKELWLVFFLKFIQY